MGLEAFHGVGGDHAVWVIADVFFLAVVHSEVFADATSNVTVPSAFTGHQFGAWLDVGG